MLVLALVGDNDYDYWCDNENNHRPDDDHAQRHADDDDCGRPDDSGDESKPPLRASIMQIKPTMTLAMKRKKEMETTIETKTTTPRKVKLHLQTLMALQLEETLPNANAII